MGKMREVVAQQGVRLLQCDGVGVVFLEGGR